MAMDEPETPAARADGLSRRSVLLTASAAALAAPGAAPALADAAADDGFGAPLVALQVPPGVLTLEQKAALIQGITDVVATATQLPPERARRLFVQIFEAAEGGFGVGGKVYVPRPR
jgi:phenylpyruvate tautomerase PptA (4-oxalocrotonate tautomerase family)